MLGYFYKRNLAVYIMTILSAIVILDFFVKVPIINVTSQHLTKWATTLASFAIIIGLLSFVRYHYREASKRKADSWLNLWSLVIAGLMIVLGLSYGASSSIYTWIWYMFNSWPYRTVTVLNSLYIMSAAYRAFRMRNLETAVLMIGGFLTLLGLAPMIAQGGGPIPALALWLSTIASSAVTRGVMIGAGVGSAAIGFRILLGRESTMKGEMEMEAEGF